MSEMTWKLLGRCNKRLLRPSTALGFFSSLEMREGGLQREALVEVDASHATRRVRRVQGGQEGDSWQQECMRALGGLPIWRGVSKPRRRGIGGTTYGSAHSSVLLARK
jgi:hypothetical protein